MSGRAVVTAAVLNAFCGSKTVLDTSACAAGPKKALGEMGADTEVPAELKNPLGGAKIDRPVVCASDEFESSGSALIRSGGC